MGVVGLIGVLGKNVMDRSADTLWVKVEKPKIMVMRSDKVLKKESLGSFLRIAAVIVALSARHVASNLFCGAPADAT